MSGTEHGEALTALAMLAASHVESRMEHDPCDDCGAEGGNPCDEDCGRAADEHTVTNGVSAISALRQALEVAEKRADEMKLSGERALISERAIFNREIDTVQAGWRECQGALRHTEELLANETANLAMVRKLASEDAMKLQKDLASALESLRGMRELLRIALPFVVPSDHEGRSEAELRDSYPDSCAVIDEIRARITTTITATSGGA